MNDPLIPNEVLYIPRGSPLRKQILRCHWLSDDDFREMGATEDEIANLDWKKRKPNDGDCEEER